MKEMETKAENRYEYRKSQEKRKQMTAPDLFEFAYVPDGYGHLAEVERLALPKSWKFRKPSREIKNIAPILERYIQFFVSRLLALIQKVIQERQTVFFIWKTNASASILDYTHSENCTWGMRKRFADGKVTVPFGRFRGYDRGEEGNLVINKEQAKLVREIYGLFLQGRSPYQICQDADGKGHPHAGRQKVWGKAVVESILINEKCCDKVKL